MIEQLYSRCRARWKQSYKLNRIRTTSHRILKPSDRPRVIFIFGCQRSGTTLLRNFIGLDPRVLDIGEGDPPFFAQEGSEYLRLLPDQELHALVNETRHSNVLLKPLHDSQRAAELLNFFDRSKGIAIYRHFLPVIDSHIRYYRHDPLQYLKPLLELDRTSWMLEGMDDAGIQRVEALLTAANGSIPDLYAVFWWVRNTLLIRQLSDDCILLSYEALVSAPHRVSDTLDQHLGMELRGLSQSMPHQRSLRKGADRSLEPEVLKSCEDLLKELRSFDSVDTK